MKRRDNYIRESSVKFVLPETKCKTKNYKKKAQSIYTYIFVIDEVVLLIVKLIGEAADLNYKLIPRP